MSREVCGICWCPYDEETGECACKVPSDCPDSHQPVAWRWGFRSVTTGEMDWRGYVEIPAHPNLRSPAIIIEPLYAAPPNCPNCASLEDQNTELDRKLAEMERKLFELQAAVFRSQGIRCSDVGT